MNSPGLRRRDKENAGAVYGSASALKLVSMSAERRPAFQESSGAPNSQAFADGTRPGGDEHLKLRISQSDVVETVVEVRQEPQQRAVAANECNDVDKKASRQLDFSLEECTERQTTNVESFRPRQAQRPAPQPDPAAAASPIMPVKKAHPVGKNSACCSILSCKCPLLHSMVLWSSPSACAAHNRLSSSARLAFGLVSNRRWMAQASRALTGLSCTC